MNNFYEKLVAKEVFKVVLPTCCIPKVEVTTILKAKIVYKWMKIGLYQYSLINFFLSFIIILIYFIKKNEYLDVSFNPSLMIFRQL